MNITTQAQSLFDGWMAGKSSPKWVESFVSGQLPKLIALLFVLLISWQASQLTWGLIPVPETPYQVTPSGPANSVLPQTSSSDRQQLSRLASLHLFGDAASKPVAQKVDTKAPETRLNLTLHGVFVAEKPEEGAAIIGTSGSVQKYYKVGSAIMSGVTLQAVFNDRVVLLRKGESEVLRFPKVDNSRVVEPVRDQPARVVQPRKEGFGPGVQTQPAESVSLSEYRDMIREEPLKIFEHVRFVPVKSRDGMKGYRILPQKNRALYNQLGVRPSDLVTSVNGIPLTNDREALQLVDKLKDAQSLQVEIIRNGQPQTLTFNLN
ncbi:MAG: type II secretion system protein GspC [Candidatus Thiodiazotropha sp.]